MSSKSDGFGDVDLENDRKEKQFTSGIIPSLISLFLTFFIFIFSQILLQKYEGKIPLQIKKTSKIIPYGLENTDKFVPVRFTLNNLKFLNKFVSLSFRFFRQNTSFYEEYPVYYRVDANLKHNNKLVSRISSTDDENKSFLIHYAIDSNLSTSVPIYHIPITNYDALDLIIWLKARTFNHNSFIATFSVTNEYSIYFQDPLRIVIISISLFILFKLFRTNTPKDSVNMTWIGFCLMILSILRSFPVYFFFRPNFCRKYDIIARQISRNCLQLCTIVYLLCLSNKTFLKDNFHLLFLLASLFFTISIVEIIYELSVLQSFFILSHFVMKYFFFFTIIFILFELLFALFLCIGGPFSIIMASRVDKIKCFCIILFAGDTCIVNLIHLFSHVLHWNIGIQENSTLSFFTQEVFSLILASLVLLKEAEPIRFHTLKENEQTQDLI